MTPFPAVQASPSSEEEWRFAARAAAGLLLIDDARLYGVLRGGPAIDRARCEELALKGDLWDRARAYEGTMESACWWWPHRRFVMVCERPLEIHRELVDPSRPRGWGSHRLHRDDGPAVAWPDGWGVWSVHGVRVPRQVVEAPETLTVEQIAAEQNTEVRRVMIDRFGADRYLELRGAQLVDEGAWGLGIGDRGRLWRLDQADDEPLVMVELINSTPEPIGECDDMSEWARAQVSAVGAPRRFYKTYFLRVPPGVATAHGAAAWTWDMAPSEYSLEAAT